MHVRETGPRSGPPSLQLVPRGHIRSWLGHVALLALSGVLLGGAFPQPGWWPLIWVALVPVGILAARTAHPRRLAASAYLVFLAWWLVRVSWLIPVTVPGWFGASAVLGLYSTLAIMSLHLVARRYPYPMTIVLPLIWVSFEFLRAHFPLGGFGWFQLGHALAPYAPQHGASRFAQVADVFGEWTVSFLVAMTNGLLVDLLIRPWFRAYVRGQPRWSSRLRRTLRGALIIWAFTFSAAWWYGQFHIGSYDEFTYPAVRVAVVQTHVPQSNKIHPTPEEDRRRWHELVDLTRRAAGLHPTPDLIVWPETMAPAALNPEAVEQYRAIADSWRGVTWDEVAASPDAARYVENAANIGVPVERYPEEVVRRNDEKAALAEEVLALARDLGVPILVGAPSENLPGDGRGNSVFLVHPREGYAARRYDKVHIVPFGEYIPFIRNVVWLQDIFLTYISPYGFDYTLTPGESVFTFELFIPPREGESAEARVVRFGTPICFEDAVASVCRAMIYAPDDRPTSELSKPGDFLVNLTNDGWFTGSAQPWQHLQLATFRSIENRVATARAVNTGVSGFIDSAGRITAILPPGVSDAAVQELRLDRRRSLFGVVGRWPAGGLTVLAGALIMTGFFRKDHTPPDA